MRSRGRPGPGRRTNELFAFDWTWQPAGVSKLLRLCADGVYGVTKITPARQHLAACCGRVDLSGLHRCTSCLHLISLVGAPCSPTDANEYSLAALSLCCDAMCSLSITNTITGASSHPWVGGVGRSWHGMCQHVCMMCVQRCTHAASLLETNNYACNMNAVRPCTGSRSSSREDKEGQGAAFTRARLAAAPAATSTPGNDDQGAAPPAATAAAACVKVMQMGDCTPNADSSALPRPHSPSPAISAQPTTRWYASAERG